MKAIITCTRTSSNNYVIKYDYKEFNFYPQTGFGYLDALRYLKDTFKLENLVINEKSGFLPDLKNICADLGIEYIEK